VLILRSSNYLSLQLCQRERIGFIVLPAVSVITVLSAVTVTFVYPHLCDITVNFGPITAVLLRFPRFSPLPHLHIAFCWVHTETGLYTRMAKIKGVWLNAKVFCVVRLKHLLIRL